MTISRELIVQDTTLSRRRNGSRNYFTKANYIEFSDVKVLTPTSNVLVEDLSLKVVSGSNLLIMVLNKALTAEVQRLKIATEEMNGDPSKFQQLSIIPQMYQPYQQQQAQTQQQQHQNGNKTKKQDQQ